MRRNSSIIIAAFFVVLCCAPKVWAINEAEFFQNIETDASMVVHIAESCGKSIECAKATHLESYDEATNFLRQKNYEQAFMAGKFSWYAAVYEGSLIENKKLRGENVSQIQKENSKYITCMADFFKISSDKEFLNILTRSVDMTNTAIDSLDDSGSKNNSQTGDAVQQDSVPDNFKNLLVSCLLGKGAIWDTKLTVNKVAEIWKKNNAIVEWEIIGEYGGVMTVIIDDKVARVKKEIRMFFETVQGGTRAVLTRSFFQGMETFLSDKDQIARDLIIRFEGQ